MARAKDHVENRNIMKEDFGWEVPVELVPLPSRGIIYDPESSLYKKEALKIKAMTAKEEDILASRALIKEGTVLDHLIASCLAEPNIDPSELTMGDRNALMIAIRITGYGPEYPVESTCRKCDTMNRVDVNLSDLTIKRLGINPVEEGKNLFEFKLPVTKKKVRFKYGTVDDQRDFDEKEKVMKKHLSALVDSTVTGALELTIESVDKVTDKNKIRHFIQYMPAYDSRALRKFMRENEPGIDMGWSYKCKNCSHENEIMIPVTTEFFWPST